MKPFIILAFCFIANISIGQENNLEGTWDGVDIISQKVRSRYTAWTFSENTAQIKLFDDDDSVDSSSFQFQQRGDTLMLQKDDLEVRLRLKFMSRDSLLLIENESNRSILSRRKANISATPKENYDLPDNALYALQCDDERHQNTYIELVRIPDTDSFIFVLLHLTDESKADTLCFSRVSSGCLLRFHHFKNYTYPYANVDTKSFGFIHFTELQKDNIKGFIDDRIPFSLVPILQKSNYTTTEELGGHRYISIKVDSFSSSDFKRLKQGGIPKIYIGYDSVFLYKNGQGRISISNGQSILRKRKTAFSWIYSPYTNFIYINEEGGCSIMKVKSGTANDFIYDLLWLGPY